MTQSTNFRTAGVKTVMLLGFVVTSCVALFGDHEPTSLPNVPAPELLLDSRPFPKGWEVDPCGPDPSRCFRASYATRSFGRFAIPGHVLQHVYRFGNVAAAKVKYQRVHEVDFGKGRNEPASEFLPPAEIAYRSPIADEYYLGCGVDIVPACEAIFRYGNYFIEFFFNVDKGYVDGVEIKGNGLKIEEVEPILRAMDERAAAVLGLRPHAEPTQTP